MPPSLRILYLEDSELDVTLADEALRTVGDPCHLLWAKNRAEFVERLRDPDLDLILSDFNLPSFDGMAALELCRTARPLLPFILLSGTVGEETAVECLRRGATDYVLKSNLLRLPMVVGRALAEVAERRARMAADEERQSLLEAATTARVVPWKQELPSRTWVFGDSVNLVLGYSPEAFRSDPGLVEMLIHPEDVHRFVSARSATGTGQPAGFDCRMRHQAGAWVWTRWTLTRSAKGYRGVLQDVSEIHARQDQLVLSQKAETAGIMVSGLCHDFNNHIMVILANAEMLEASALPTAQGKLVDTIQRAGVRSRDLVRQLMGFARKNQETHRIRQDLRDLVGEGGALLKHLLRPQVRLELIPGEGPYPVSVDPGQIIQVIMNLGINAQDAITGDGTIRLRTGSERLGSTEAEAQGREPGSYAFLEVEDSGSGIPEQIQARIFDPFFTTKAPGKGTGLGLAMVHAITKGHDGILQCDSILGQGTRIRILLPGLPPDDLD